MHEKMVEKLKAWSVSSGVKGPAYSAMKSIVMEELNEMMKMSFELSRDYEKLCRSEERLRMENAMQYNRLRVLNRAATNYTIQFDQDGKEISASEFKEQWIKARGNLM
jgi:hypothetical protein